MAAEEKLAKQEKKEQRLKKVAEIEEKLLDEDNDVTPRPTRHLQWLYRSRASTHAFIPLYRDNPSESKTEGPAKSDTTSQDQESHAASDHGGSLDPDPDMDTDTEIEQQPAVKKQKASQSKPSDTGGPAHQKPTRPRERAAV